jgi:hypothetical protein
MSDYANFRQRLDAVLRARDVVAVRQFLIDEGQWQEGVPADPEFAMWIMIASSPGLRELHEQAREWLITHGHEVEAQAVLGKGRPGAAKPGRGTQPKRGSHPTNRTAQTSSQPNRSGSSRRKGDGRQ